MFLRLLIGAVVVLFLVMWVRAVFGVFFRRPFVGLLIYTMLRPADSQIASRRRKRS
jgi:type IV secretory pathway TrbD component